MRSIGPFVVSLVVAVVGLPGAVVAQDTAGVGTIVGTVRDGETRAVAGVRVCLVGTDRCTSSDKAGLFEIAELRPVDRTFTVLGDTVIVFAGVQNLTNRRNWVGYSWDRRANGVRFDEQLGLLPVLELDWRF